MGSLRPIAIACALLVPLAAVADDLIRFSLSAGAAACCAKVKDCASFQAPDTCCQTRQQAPGQGFDSSLPDLRVALSSPAVAVVLHGAADAFPFHRAGESRTADSFKRPHDLPHLHPFNLLI